MSPAISEYERQAIDFCEKTGTKIDIQFYGHGPHFDHDDITRDIYQVTIERNKKKFSFKFGNSIINSEYATGSKGYMTKLRSSHVRGNRRVFPTSYDILASISKCDPGTHEDFCCDYGYDTDSRNGLNIYLKVQEEWNNVNRLFHDVLDELSEIA